ncbi:MAG TPA: NAD(P)/FAD-dependent oxidoreductase [Candidatus Baltobacteraceae bacterium]|nr:NAD(P)/FAD-dependent oxidoreductase [Candidatus Baltobacteraceae bacterium]
MKIAVIGGGAAGLMAAAAIHENSPETETFLIERNDGLGKKVIISGGGRCNVTTGLRDVREVLSKYPRGGKFLNSAMRRFPPEAVYAWFEAHGVPLKIEEDLRVFPQSDDGHDVVGAFERLFEGSRVQVMLKRHAIGIERTDGGYRIRFKDGQTLEADRVILTTGGQAFRHTGSTGDGYAFAESLGHRVTPLAPSLNSFFTKEAWPKDVSGLSFEKARLRTKFAKAYEFTGPVLFTHRGVSGPAVFALSSLVAFEKYDAASPMDLRVDIFPDVTEDELFAKLEAMFREHPAKILVKVLDFLMSRSLAEVACRELGLDEGMRVAEVPKKDARRIAAWLKGIPLTVIGRGAGDEFVTAGGVDLKDVDPKTMESKISPGLYFAGEILDIDGFTGGFNLQASWAAGRVAGENAVL